MFFKNFSWGRKSGTTISKINPNGVRPNRKLNPHARTHAPIRLSAQKTAVIGDKQVAFTLTLSRRVRGVYLKINPRKGLEVVVPYRYNLENLHRLFREKADWILKHLQKLEERQRRQVKFVDGAQISLFGIPKIIRIEISAKKMRAKVEENEQEIIIKIFDTSEAKKILERYLRQCATDYFLRRTEELSQIMKTSYGKITVRAQKSRWGSCSRHNDLSLNWHLIFMPVAVMDYVIIHELAHTVHHNHSRRFYALVEKFCPDYKNLRKILKNQAHAIID